MSSDNQPILGVPTNIITGFLGVGKTSAILNLMANKQRMNAGRYWSMSLVKLVWMAAWFKASTVGSNKFSSVKSQVVACAALPVCQCKSR